MTVAFSARPTATAVELTVSRKKLFGGTQVPIAEWAALPEPERRAAQTLLALVETGAAMAAPASVTVPHTVAAELPPRIADLVGLPPLSSLSATLSLVGRVETQEGHIRVRWYDATSRIVHPHRTGIVLQWGDKQVGRLSKPVFDLV